MQGATGNTFKKSLVMRQVHFLHKVYGVNGKPILMEFISMTENKDGIIMNEINTVFINQQPIFYM
jgi:hypothetical protein